MSVHKKMTRSERAKQFMPFAALKGYSDALKRTEEEVLRAYEEETDREVSGEKEDHKQA